MIEKRLRAFVDRVEGGTAVLLIGDREEEQMLVPVSCLPEDVGEGAVLSILIRFEPELTEVAAEDAARLIRRLTRE